MNDKNSPSFYKEEFEPIDEGKDITGNPEPAGVNFELENDILQLEETDKRERLLSVLLADFIWTINAEGKVTYINPFVDDCIGNDSKYVVKRIVSRYLAPSSVMACLIELEELNEMLRTSKHTQQRKLVVDMLKNESDIEKVEISTSAIFDTQGNIVGIQGLCKYLK